MKQYPLIQLPGLQTIEAEKDEVIVGPDKVAYEIGGKSHKQGGTKMIAEEGSYILSRHLKLPKSVVKSLGYNEEEMSPADIARKTPTGKYMDVIKSKNRRYDALAKKTAALMFEKSAARLDLTFSAQEDFKASRGMKNDADRAAMGRQQLYQKGGAIDQGPVYEDPFINGVDKPFSLSPIYDPYEEIKPFQFSNAQGFTQLDAKNTLGYSQREGDKKVMYFRPFANDPYFEVQKELLKGNGMMTAEQKKILGQRQQRLSDLKGQFPGETGAVIEKEYAKYLRDADKIENDQFLDKFVKLSDGSEIPLHQATDEQIDQANGFRFLNKRTGKPDLVDYRDRQNQGFDPTLRFEQREPMGLTNFDPIPTRGLSAPHPNPVIPRVPTPAIDPKQGAGAIKKGMDMQSIVNGVQMGLLAADMANTRTKPPYYDYRPSEIAYTRFEPLNTKQQERAFSIARQSIENSNLPASVKTAQLANLSANLAEGVNQIDLNNYQNKLANDNRNIDTFSRARNFDIQNEQQKNLAYVAEADRRNSQADVQKQVYLTNIMDIWRSHVNNRRDIGLVNQFSRNYDYNLNSQQVEYQAGQGVPPSTNQLAAFETNKVDPRYLNAEGLRALGFQQ